MGRIVHCWRAVYLNQPRFQFFVYHEIIPVHLGGVPPPLYLVSHTLYRPLHNRLHHRLDFLEENVSFIGLLQVNHELLLAPHVALDVALLELFRVLSHTVVGEVGEAVCEIFIAVLLSTKANVALLIKPNFRLIRKLTYQHPLPNVKLPIFYQHRILNVFLNHVLGFFPNHTIQYFLHSSHALYASPTRKNFSFKRYSLVSESIYSYTHSSRIAGRFRAGF